MQAEAGRTCKGKVIGITHYGAFVKLEDGTNGLIHISQVSDSYVSEVGDFLSVGQDVQPRILSVDEKGRVSLTLKTNKESQPMLFKLPRTPEDFEGMLEQFKTVSDEKLNALRRQRSRRK